MKSAREYAAEALAHWRTDGTTGYPSYEESYELFLGRNSLTDAITEVIMRYRKLATAMDEAVLS